MKFNDQFKKLDDIGSVGRGKSKHRPRNDASLYGGEYPFIQTGDVRKAEYYLTEFTQTYNEKGLAQSKLWDEGTLCITIAANIAETAVLGIKACFPDSIIGFIPYENKADVRFVKYCLETYKLQMQALSKGATQDNLSLEKLRSLNFLIPKIDEQRKIANILYSYDELIQNNTKRISILEQMTEQLYKEWFVRMRFPNYENTKFIKGIPSVWNILPVEKLVNRKRFGKTYKQDEVFEEGKVIVIDQSVKDYLGFHNQEADHNASVNNPYLLFGDHSCKMVLMTEPFSLGENIIPFLPKEDIQPYFLFQLINELVETIEYKRHWKELVVKKVVIPNSELQVKFSELIKPFFKEKEILVNSIRNLKKTRDLLLPRLISGKLKIE
jgi:type I restriction enzyme S subunit